MKVVVLVAFLALCGLAKASIITRQISLRVDHFNPFDRRTFDARYFINKDHWIPGGPLFIYVSGGFETYDQYLTRGTMYDLARDTNGYVLALEHRYFGTSVPTEDASTENLRWLTIHQTLADIAQFITFIKSNYYGAENVRVILFGRLYGGALAVWARQKYPTLVDAAWASSAPIDATLEYPRFMSNAYYTSSSIGGPACGNIFHDAMRMIEDAVRARNMTYVEERLRLCTPVDLDDQNDIARLYYGIAADYGYSFVSNARYPEIDDKCTLMRALNDPSNPPSNALDAFARWFVDDFNRNLECLDFNNTAVVARYQQTAWNTVSTVAGRRQTFWLQCSQLGQFAIANEGERHPFGWRFDLSFFRIWCAQVFGEEL